jgi:hypothetical protein
MEGQRLTQKNLNFIFMHSSSAALTEKILIMEKFAKIFFKNLYDYSINLKKI